MNAVFDVVFPVFGIVLLSFGLARAGVLNANTSEGLTRFMFYVAVPAMLFRTLASVDLPESIPWKYLVAFYGASFLLFAAGTILSRYGFRWQRRDDGIVAITASYSNMVMLGFPLVISAFGDAGALPLFILLAFQSTLMFPATTWMVEVYGRDADGPRPNILLGAVKLLLNPVILSLALGIVVNVFSIPVAGPLTAILTTIGAAAPACALVALGTGLAQYELRGEFTESMVLVALKGIAHPLLAWTGCRVMNIEPLWTQVAVVLAAMPTGINAFIFAKNYDIRVGVVSKSIVLSTLLSMLTVSVLLKVFIG